MEALDDFLRAALGLGLPGEALGVGQMALRAAVVYIVTLAIVRMAKKRFMGRATAFDVILGIMLGSIVSRAVTGNAPFLPALAAAAVLVAAHWACSGIALHWPAFGTAIKGRPRVLVRGGEVRRDALRAAHMSDHDLWEDLRSKGIGALDQIADARLERSGSVSVVKAEGPPRIVEVRVAAGVQTVRVELG